MRPLTALCSLLRTLAVISTLIVCLYTGLSLWPRPISTDHLTSSSSGTLTAADINEQPKRQSSVRTSARIAPRTMAIPSNRSSLTTTTPVTSSPTTAKPSFTTARPVTTSPTTAWSLFTTARPVATSSTIAKPSAITDLVTGQTLKQTELVLDTNTLQKATLLGRNSGSFIKPVTGGSDSSSPHLSGSNSFQIRQGFHWPQPRAVRGVRELADEQWLADLQSSLLRLSSHEVVLLTSNQQYTEVLLNWLVAAVTRASLDITQMIVVAMDGRLHSLLEERGVTSVLVRPESLLTSSAVREGTFPSVMMTRLAIIRLLNHWGYDVINFDTDAILLRDPSHILHSTEHIIGTFGRFPVDLTKRWGITLCTAVLVVRSSPATEEYWEAVSRAAPTSFSDQGKMNYGLKEMSVKWTLPSRNLGSLSHPVQGECHNGLRVSLLPYNIACRAGSCTRKAVSARLYVWHKGGARAGEKKREGAREGGAWLLRSDWRTSCGTKQGREWLRCISM